MSIDNEKRIAVWGNKKKAAGEESEKAPDFRGELTLDGVKYRVSLWKRKADEPANRPALSGRIEPDQAQQPKDHPSGTEQARAYAAATGGDPDGDIPF